MDHGLRGRTGSIPGRTPGPYDDGGTCAPTTAAPSAAPPTTAAPSAAPTRGRADHGRAHHLAPCSRRPSRSSPPCNRRTSPRGAARRGAGGRACSTFWQRTRCTSPTRRTPCELGAVPPRQRDAPRACSATASACSTAPPSRGVGRHARRRRRGVRRAHCARTDVCELFQNPSTGSDARF